MTSHITLTVADNAGPNSIAGATVSFQSDHLKGLSDSTLGRVIKDAIVRSEEFIARKKAQLEEQQLDPERN